MNEEAEYELIQTDDALEGLVAQVRAADRVALDTEADSLHHYFEKTCLIQVGLQDQAKGVEAHLLVDPLAGLDLQPLLDALAHARLVLHGADYDLRMLMAGFGFSPRAELFDTMLAAQLLGLDRLGLASLVEQYFQVKLSKKAQKADWARRPLSPKLLSYAADDTRYLFGVADRLSAQLAELGRIGWHRESCAHLVEVTAVPRREEPESAWRIKGTGKLTPKELHMLRAAWRWRDGEARSIDRPPFRVLHNTELIDLAVWLAGHPRRRPGNNRLVARRCHGGRLASLDENIALARTAPPEQYPEALRSRRKPGVGPLFKPLRLAGRELAESLGIDPAVLAPRAAIEGIARDLPEDVAGLRAAGDLMAWQAEQLEPVLRPILIAGKTKSLAADGP